MNTILLEDCLAGMKTMPPDSFDLLLTDPPYGMSFISNYRKQKYDAIANDQGLEWLPEWVDLVSTVVKPDAHGYVFCSFHNVATFIVELQRKFSVKNILVWEKNNTGMGDLKGDYAPKYEFILFLKGSKHIEIPTHRQ